MAGKTLIVRATSTTEVKGYVPEFDISQFKVTRFEATGAHANSKVTVYIPRLEFQVKLNAAAAASQANIQVPVDTAGGHVVHGHTLLTTDFILLRGSSGWYIEGISTVTDVGGQSYCTVALSNNLGVALVANERLFVVRGVNDTWDYTIGAASKSQAALFIGEPGTPVCVSATSGDATNTIANITGDYV